MDRSSRRSSKLWVGVVATALAWSSSSFAQPVDPGAAREQLKQGFALKQQGKFAEALPHLLESLRLDPQVKTLMNLADTEEHVGKLVDASRHWIAARDKAAGAGDEAARAEATKRLDACEARMPKLTIALSGVDPASATVKRDAVVLGAVSLGVPLPADPGAHVVLVEAAGFESRTFDVTLAEGEKRTLAVSPGPKVAAPTPPPPAPKPAEPVTAAPLTVAPTTPPPDPKPAPRGLRPETIAGIAAAGVGVVLLGIGTAEFLSARSKHDDAVENHCPENRCDARAIALQSDARSAIHASNALDVAGAILIVGGGATVALTWRRAPATTGTAFAPVVSPNGGGVVWKGAF